MSNDLDSDSQPSEPRGGIFSQFGNFFAQLPRIVGLMSDPRYRYGIVLFYGSVALAVYITHNNLIPALVVLALIPMFLLFSLMHEHRPTDWNPEWTFRLMRMYFFISVIVMSYVSLSLFINNSFASAATTRAYEFKKQWHEKFEEDYHKMDTDIMKNNLDKFKTLDLNKIPMEIARPIEGNDIYKTNIPKYVDFFESWLGCRHETNCRSREVDKFFDGILFEFWANYRCFVNNLRTNGYPSDYGARIHSYYETLPDVTSGRLRSSSLNNKAPVKHSLEIC